MNKAETWLQGAFRVVLRLVFMVEINMEVLWGCPEEGNLSHTQCGVQNKKNHFL